MATKAIALISGGLDSLLAAKVIQEQGIYVKGIAFVMSAAFTDVTEAGKEIKEISEAAGIPVRVIDISAEFLEVLSSPRNGYGANMNPCIDCKILMMEKAREIMEQEKALFLISGEVLGERPMSQNKKALDLIQKSSGLDRRLLRPLSARLLDETLPEEQGVVDRARLLEISGRSRKPQLAMAKHYGIKRFSAPGVSCLLTDPLFSSKIKDLLGGGPLEERDIDLLKYGRHFRLSRHTKAIVGRDERENRKLRELRVPGEKILRMEKCAGPDVLLTGEISPELISKAAALAVSHSKHRGRAENRVGVWEGLIKEEVVVAGGLEREEIDRIRI